MGLFSNIKRIFSDVRDIAKTVVPLAVPLIGAGFAGFALSRFLPKLLAGGPPMGAEGLTTGAGGAFAVAAANQARPFPGLGVLGSQFAAANPLTRAFSSPGFQQGTLPARPAVGRNALIQQLLALLQGPPQQTTSFNQQAFGASVSPSFRPFAPSFRSGQAGFGGPFRPGISRGLAVSAADPFGRQPVSQAFDPVFQQIISRTPQQFGFRQPRVQAFGGFGGFGGFGRGFF